MTGKVSALRLGSPVRFEDRWHGSIAAIEITEDWEVVNVVVESGILFWQASVRLPFSTATAWNDSHLAMACTSGAAFRHEVPPLAVPSRPVGRETPLSISARFAGVLVSALDRQVKEVIISRSVGAMNRVPVTDASFEAKILRIGALPETLPRYSSDTVIDAEIRRLIRDDRGLTGDDKRGLRISVAGGAVTVGGNARVPNAIERAAQLVSRIPGVTSVTAEAVDDLTLETNIGLAIDRSGLSHHADVYARSSIGVVTLFGYVPNAAADDDIIRAVVAVPGVREVISRLETAAA
ncbi:MAG TPA: BON domain-containing protein [Dehalococcoidia bacterium]|nr:BON domain-containing protein [Dehalococcoidia bacterium]